MDDNRYTYFKQSQFLISPNGGLNTRLYSNNIMKKITAQMRDAFIYGESFRKDNTEVRVEDSSVSIYLFGNKIASRSIESTDTIVTNCGWFSNTTKERLNALPNVRIHQKNYHWYLNGEQWNGAPTTVKF